ncbi:MAG: hypothetical protein ACM357_02470 [Gemmatimonadota bacterium]
MGHRFLRSAVARVALPVALAACGGGPTYPESGLRFYKASLVPTDTSRTDGAAFIDVVGGDLRVRVHATGVEPGQHIPQHLHANRGCDPGGPVLLNLDANLTVPGEAPGTGAAFPLASRGGVIDYEAARPLDELRSAIVTWGGPSLEDTDDLLAYLDLEDRNVHLHVAFGPPFPAVTCGGVEPIH